MIISQLKGGLGNQLFQYACGRALVLRQEKKGLNPGKLKLDISGYGTQNGTDTPRQYILAKYNIDAEIATPEEIKKLKYPFGIISKARRYLWVKVLKQGNFSFRKYIFDSKGQTYLDSFFQTEKYFIDHEQEIRRELTLKNPLGETAQTALVEIQKTSISVSMHVRRGDIVQQAEGNPYYGICTPEYYSEALSSIAEKIGGKEFKVFVFSDDIEWVKKNITIPYPTKYVSLPEIADYEELYLMSKCDHNIIANSSFSWWGAWFNQNLQKIVIAPKLWVTRMHWWHKDTVPESWTRI